MTQPTIMPTKPNVYEFCKDILPLRMRHGLTPEDWQSVLVAWVVMWGRETTEDSEEFIDQFRDWCKQYRDYLVEKGLK